MSTRFPSAAEPTHTTGSGPLRSAATSLATLCAALACVLLVPTSSAFAQAAPAIAPEASPPRDDVHAAFFKNKAKPDRIGPEDKAGTAKARVRVVRRSVEGAEGTPVADVEVKLLWRGVMGRNSLLSWKKKTGEDGWADFGEVDVLGDPSRFELRARVDDGPVSQESPRLFAKSGAIEGEVQLLTVTTNTADVIGVSHSTVMLIPEGLNDSPSLYKHVEVQQIFELSTAGLTLYNSEAAMSAEEARGVRFDAPTKALGVHGQVVGGSGGNVETTETAIYFRGVVFPEGPEYAPARVLMRYYIKVDGSSLDFEQIVHRPYKDVRVTFVRDTDLPNMGLLNIGFENHAFTEFTDVPEEDFLRKAHVQVARGLSLAAGQTLSFRVTGLPYPEDRIPWYLAILAFALIFAGIPLGISEARKSKERKEALEAGDPEALAELDNQVEALFVGLTELERDFLSGAVDENDYVTEQERLKTRIALMKQQRDRFLGGRRA